VDIVPFGPIATNTQTIAWPPEQAVEMNVLGFEDAYRHAQLVRLKAHPELTVPFASPAGLAIMKTIAWRDRGSDLRVKDALDLAYLMRTYADANNMERLYEQHADLLAHHDFALEPSGARLLGRDISMIASQETRDAILNILDRETGEQPQYRLVEDMIRTASLGDRAFEDTLMLLEALKLGIKDAVT
jgi:predicted nucleotidyltransferase